MAFNLGSAEGVIRVKYDGASSVKRAITDVGSLRAALQAAGVTGYAGAKLMTAGFGVALVGGLALAVTKAAQFEKQISGIAAVSNATGPQLDKIRAKALQLGADTQFSASEAASAMEELVKAGLSVDEVLNGAADAAVSLAAAGGITIPEAATIAANAMNQFGLAAEALPGVVDNIAGAANSSAIDVSDLGQSLQQVGAVAHLAGLDFADTATAIGLLGNAGIRGSDAGTSLKTMLQNLQPVTTRQIDLFKSLGLVTEDGSNKFFDAQGNVKSLAGVSETLQDALRGQTRQQKLLNLETLFGSDAIRAAAILANQGAEGVHKFTEEMNKTTAADVAAKRMDNLAGSFEQLKGSAETLAIVVGSALLDPLRRLVDMATEGTNAITDIATEVGHEAAPGFQDLGVAVQNTVEFFLKLWDAVEPLVNIAVLLGLGGAIALFNSLAQILASVTGLVNKFADEAIAAGAALLIMQAGGVKALAVALLDTLVLGLNQVLIYMGRIPGVAGAATGAIKGFSSAGAAFKSIGLAVAIFAVIQMWQAYSAAVDEAKRIQQDANDAISEGSVEALGTSLKSLEDFTAQFNDQADSLVGNSGIGGFFKNAVNVANPLNWSELFNTAGMASQVDEVDAQAEQVRAAIGKIGGAAVTVADQLKLVDPTKLQEMLVAAQNGDPTAIRELDDLIAKIRPQVEATGTSWEDFINMTSTFDMTGVNHVLDAIIQLNTNTGRTAAASDQLAQAFVAVDGGATDAADAASALQDALDSLIGKEVSAQQAAIDFRNDLRDLKSQIDKNSRALIGTGAAADKNKTAINALVNDLTKQIAAQADAGVGADKLALNLRRGRKELVNTAVQLGFNRKELNKYLDTLNLTPDQVQSIIEAVGATTAREQMKALIQQYHLTPNKVSSIIEAAGADTAKEKVKALLSYINQLHDKTITITTLNRTAAGQQAAHDFNQASGGVYPAGIYHGARYMFAEAGGEAFIPMRRDKRRRSEWLLSQVAAAFGGAFVKMAEGGVMGNIASAMQTPWSSEPQIVMSGPTQGKVSTKPDVNIVTHIYNPYVREGADDVTSRLTSIANSGLFG